MPFSECKARVMEDLLVYMTWFYVHYVQRHTTTDDPENFVYSLVHKLTV